MDGRRGPDAGAGLPLGARDCASPRLMRDECGTGKKIIPLTLLKVAASPDTALLVGFAYALARFPVTARMINRRTTPPMNATRIDPMLMPVTPV